MEISINKRDYYIKTKKILAILTATGFFITCFGLVLAKIIQPEINKDASFSLNLSELIVIQENSLLAVSDLSQPADSFKKIKGVVTGYSSTPEQTDSTPFITASGKLVKEGIVANNMLPFGTKIRIPEVYGDKVFVVEDRMHWQKNGYCFDVWFPEYEQAKNFGVKITYIEILKN